jgi:predicted kinase
LAERLNAVHVRVDTIEQAIRASGIADDAGPAGYIVAYGIAGDNLTLGRTVIADSVNPLRITRSAWLSVAQAAGVTAAEVEVVCSDKAEHRNRAETRLTDVEGLVKPTWQAISERTYDEWPDAIVIDTALKTVEAAVDELIDRLGD